MLGCAELYLVERKRHCIWGLVAPDGVECDLVISLPYAAAAAAMHDKMKPRLQMRATSKQSHPKAKVVKGNGSVATWRIRGLPYMMSAQKGLYYEIIQICWHMMTNTTEWMEWMTHRKRKETKQQPGTAEPGNIPGCFLVSLRFVCDIHSIHSTFCGQRGQGWGQKIQIFCGRHMWKTPHSQNLCTRWGQMDMDAMLGIYLHEDFLNWVHE